MGGALALDVAWLFAAFLLILVLIASGIATRRFLLERGGGTVDCSLRRTPGEGSWRLGLAAYQGDRLCWDDQCGVLLRPRLQLERRTLTVASRRDASPAEDASLGPGMIVVECAIGDADPGGTDRVELAMSDAALTGFLAWLEAAPPGSYMDQIA